MTAFWISSTVSWVIVVASWILKMESGIISFNVTSDFFFHLQCAPVITLLPFTIFRNLFSHCFVNSFFRSAVFFRRHFSRTHNLVVIIIIIPRQQLQGASNWSFPFLSQSLIGFPQNCYFLGWIRRQQWGKSTEIAFSENELVQLSLIRCDSGFALCSCCDSFTNN